MNKFSYLPAFILFLLSSSFASDAEQKTGLIIYINKDKAVGNFNVSKFSNRLAGLVQQLVVSNAEIPPDLQSIDSLTIDTPERLFAADSNTLQLKNAKYDNIYIIIGTVKQRNGLVSVSAAAYYVYQKIKLKYLSLFEITTKNYHTGRSANLPVEDRVLSEMAGQLKKGFDNSIHFVFEPVILDNSLNEFEFIKKAVPEYLKARLILSNKIKVLDEKSVRIAGLEKKAQYSVRTNVFNYKDRIYVVIHCIENNEDRLIISRQVSFSMSEPKVLDSLLLDVGDELRNSALNLYNNKILSRKKNIAIIAKPPFFCSRDNVDEYGMQCISKKLINSFISSFRTDTSLLEKFEYVRDPYYFDKVESYLCNYKELSVISNELDAELLIIIQTIGRANDFDLNIEKYDCNAFTELKPVHYFSKIKQYIIKDSVDIAYKNIREELLGIKKEGVHQQDSFHESFNKSYSVTERDNRQKENTRYTKPSDFYELIPEGIGFRAFTMNSLIFNNSKDLFFGNHLRPAVEIGAFYSFSPFWDIPVSLDLSYMYDFGDRVSYKKNDILTGNSGTVFARNINAIVKVYYPFYGRVKNLWRCYLGSGLILIDIHHVSTATGSCGSFDPGIIYLGGLEYNLSYNLYLEFSGRFLISGKTFKTLLYEEDAISYGKYESFYMGFGAGWAF